MTTIPDLDLVGFATKVLALMRGSLDVDGSDLQDAAVKYGILVELPLTKEECEYLDEAQEYDCREGDTWLYQTPAFRKALDNWNTSPPVFTIPSDLKPEDVGSFLDTIEKAMHRGNK